jgi:hypothetical protein
MAYSWFWAFCPTTATGCCVNELPSITAGCEIEGERKFSRLVERDFEAATEPAGVPLTCIVTLAGCEVIFILWLIVNALVGDSYHEI